MSGFWFFFVNFVDWVIFYIDPSCLTENKATANKINKTVF